MDRGCEGKETRGGEGRGEVRKGKETVIRNYALRCLFTFTLIIPGNARVFDRGARFSRIHDEQDGRRERKKLDFKSIESLETMTMIFSFLT